MADCVGTSDRQIVQVLEREYQSGRPQYNPSGSPDPAGGKQAARAGLTVGARKPRPYNAVNAIKNCCKVRR